MVNILLWKRYTPSSLEDAANIQLESIYRISPYVLSICIYADINQTKPVAIVIPVESAVRDLAIKLGAASTAESYESLQDTRVIHEVHMDMLAVAKAHGLRSVELIQGVVLVTEEWTPENVLSSIPLHCADRQS
jgi:long-chain acyl-CoA synthetase